MKLIGQIVIGVLAISGVVLGVVNFQTQPKLAYIDTEKLLSDFEATKEATNKLITETEKWDGTIDSLKSVFMAKRENFITDSSMLSVKDRQSEKETLLTLKYKISQIEARKQQEFKVVDQRLSTGILNQVNVFLEKYCEENGYQLVLGATPGVILYANDAIDITDAVIDELNKGFDGQ